MNRNIAITGLGAVCALGTDTVALWSAIESGRDGIRPIDRYSTDGFSTNMAALVPGFANGKPSSSDLPIAWAIMAAREALAEAGPIDAPPERIALVLGTSLSTYKDRLHRLTEQIGDCLDVRGPRVTVSTACTSSTNAIGLGKDLLNAGVADRVIAGGTDLLSPEIFAGFHALGLLASTKCAPFSEPTGTTLGEGAGFLILEDEQSARRRHASFSAILRGYGLSADAYHATSPDPGGAGVARAIAAALHDAGIDAAEIDYINAHGTGTPANDPAEWRAIQTVFGTRSDQLPISSTKAHFGHAQGAAGVLELIATLLCMRRGMIPPTLHFTKPRPRGPVDPVAQDHPRRVAVRNAICTNSAFGGANAALVVGARDARISVPEDKRENPQNARRISILGFGTVGAHGLGLDDFDQALVRGHKLGRRVPDFRIEDFVPTADPRGLDPSSRYLTAAAAMALSSAGVALRGAARDRAGIFVGMERISPESGNAFDASIEERGLPRLSAGAFTKMVLNASAGVCSKLLKLKGPTTALTTGEGSGLSALVIAARYLATRRDADVLVVGAVDEWSPTDKGEQSAEGAVCLVLGASEMTTSAANVVIDGWGLAGPGHIDVAVKQACDMAKVSVDQVERASTVEPIWGKLEASGSLFTCISAIRTLHRGEARRILIADGDGRSVSTAVVLAVANTQENTRES